MATQGDTNPLSNFQPKSKIITGTTDGNGNLDLQLTYDEADMVLRIDNNYLVYIPFIYQGQWYARVQQSNAAGQAVTNTSMTVTVIYH